MLINMCIYICKCICRCKCKCKYIYIYAYVYVYEVCSYEPLFQTIAKPTHVQFIPQLGWKVSLVPP